MQRVRRMGKPQVAWLAAAALITALSLLLVFAPSARANQSPQLVDDLQQSQIYDDDLEVERGQVLEGDVNVYSGDVVVRREGRIQGNLNVYSGDVEIEAGGWVDGNVTSWSGDVRIDGRIDGSVAAMAGDVEVGGAALVGGDISVMAGNIKQRAGAEVGGNILRGPDINLPAPPAIGLLPWLGTQQEAELQPPDQEPGAGSFRDGFWGRPLGFVGRGLTGLLLLGLFVAGAAAIAAFRPAWAQAAQGTLVHQAALSFATGLIANVLLLAVIGFLYVTICLRPPALLLAVGLLAFNVAGMAAVGAEIGGRLSERLRGAWTQTSRTALGVAVPGAIIVFLWAVGGCFAFFGSVGALLLGSFGVGAILVRALNLGAKGPVTPAAAPAPEGAEASAPPTAAAAPAPMGAPADAPVSEASAASQPAEPQQWWVDATRAAEAAHPAPEPPLEPSLDPAAAPAAAPQP